MHIQDGYLSTPVCVATATVATAAVGFSLHKLKNSLADRTVPLTGMMASLIFAGQMVNFPIGLPVSGHLLGGVLAAAVLGPWAGCVAISLVLLVQWALFSDGGLTALGANILHMGVIGSIGGYAVMSTIRRLLGGGFRGNVMGAVIAAWGSVLAAATLFCVEFRLSYSASEFDFGKIFTLMVTLHALIGIGEAVITGVIVGMIYQHRVDLIHSPQSTGAVRGASRFVVAGLIASLAIGAFLAPFASEWPDGLDKVAEQFSIPSTESRVAGMFEDYDKVPSPIATWQSLSVSIAGIGGTLIVFGIAMVLGRLAPRETPASSEAAA
mgnify:CR=1 FL=1